MITQPEQGSNVLLLQARRDQPRGYRKRMHQLWQQRGNFECTEQ